MTTPLARRILLATGVVLVGAVLLASDYWTFLAIGALITGLVAYSVGIVYGRGGMVTLCQLTFAAVGAWTAGAVNIRAELGLPVLLLVGAAATVPVGLVVGGLSLRLRGINLGVATLAFASATSVVLRQIPFPGSLTNETTPRPAGFTSQNGFFLFCLIFAGIVVVLVERGGRSRTGRGLLATRQSERATAMAGLDVTRIKLVAFLVSAAIAGAAGVLLAAQNGLVGFRGFEPLDSLVIFALAVNVGARYVDGALAAGVLGILLPEVLRTAGLPLDIAPLLFGVGVVVVLSQGGDGAHGQLRRLLARRRAAKGPPSSDIPTTPGPVRPARHEPREVTGRPASLTPRTVLELDRVGARYGAVTALADVSLELRRGELHGLIGPNGAGKSTLVDVVTGFRPDHSGVVRLAGRDLGGASPKERARAGVRRTFQQERTIQELTVIDYLTLCGGRRPDPQALALMSGLVPSELLERRIETVDIGTRRLIEVAGALAGDPEVLLLDEPAAGLGPAESTMLAAELERIPEDFSCALLLIEHDVPLVAQVCDAVTVLSSGRVLAQGSPSQVLQTEAVQTAFLGRRSGGAVARGDAVGGRA